MATKKKSPAKGKVLKFDAAKGKAKKAEKKTAAPLAKLADKGKAMVKAVKKKAKKVTAKATAKVLSPNDAA